MIEETTGCLNVWTFMTFEQGLVLEKMLNMGNNEDNWGFPNGKAYSKEDGR